jgi:hypothetical protein
MQVLTFSSYKVMTGVRICQFFFVIIADLITFFFKHTPHFLALLTSVSAKHHIHPQNRTRCTYIPSLSRATLPTPFPIVIGQSTEVKLFQCFLFTNRCTCFLVLESTKIHIKIHSKMLLRVSVLNDHHQEAF